MRLLDLKCFVAIAEEGGLSQASLVVGISQPGLSRVLRDLETRLKAQLVRRTGRGVELTDAGRVFLDFALDTLANYYETRDRVQSLSNQMPSHLRIAVPIRLERLLSAPLLAAFSRDFPEVTVEILESYSEASLKMLSEGRCDVMIGYLQQPKAPKDPPVYSEEIFLVGVPKLIGSAGTPIDLSEAAELKFLLPSGTHYRAMLDAAFEAVGKPIIVARRLETAEAIVAFAAEGEGAALLAYSNVYREVERGELAFRPISPPGVRRDIVLNISRNLSPAITKLTAVCVKAALAEVAPTARWFKSPRAGLK